MEAARGHFGGNGQLNDGAERSARRIQVAGGLLGGRVARVRERPERSAAISAPSGGGGASEPQRAARARDSVDNNNNADETIPRLMTKTHTYTFGAPLCPNRWLPRRGALFAGRLAARLFPPPTVGEDSLNWEAGGN